MTIVYHEKNKILTAYVSDNYLHYIINYRITGEQAVGILTGEGLLRLLENETGKTEKALQQDIEPNSQ